MKTSIATIFKLGFFVGIIILVSCTSTPETDKNPVVETTTKIESIAKRWTLSDKAGEKEKTMEIILSMKENGYFMIYDTIIDKKFIEAGINKIQPISKGQWKLKEEKLILNHIQNDSSHVEEFSIKSMDANKLVLVGSNNKSHTYLSH